MRWQPACGGSLGELRCGYSPQATLRSPSSHVDGLLRLLYESKYRCSSTRRVTGHTPLYHLVAFLHITSEMPSSIVSRIASADIDGRARSPRYIQRQLSRLHEALTSQISALHAAIVTDSGVDPAEAEVELFLAVQAVKSQYANIGVPKMLADEYSVARREDWSSRKAPAGIVCIRPQSHTLLFSVISPLSSAIAAGNCAFVEVSTLGSYRGFVI